MRDEHFGCASHGPSQRFRCKTTRQNSRPGNRLVGKKPTSASHRCPLVDVLQTSPIWHKSPPAEVVMCYNAGVAQDRTPLLTPPGALGRVVFEVVQGLMESDFLCNRKTGLSRQPATTGAVMLSKSIIPRRRRVTIRARVPAQDELGYTLRSTQNLLATRTDDTERGDH